MHSSSNVSVVIAFGLSVGCVAVAHAQVPAQPSPPSPATPSQSESPVTFGGYAEAFYQWNFNDPSNGITNFRGFDNRHNSFTLSNVAFDALWDRESLVGRLTLQVGHTPSTYYLAEPALPGASGANATDGEVWKYLQQAYVGYRFDVGRGPTLSAGLFLSPIGPESMAVRDNWNWSRSNLFFGLPFYHTGVRATYALSDAWAVTLAGYNGWNSVVDNNQEKSVSAQVTFTRPEVVLSMLYFGGIERASGAPEGRAWRHLVDAHVTWHVTPPGLFACYNAAASGVAVSGDQAGKPVTRVVVGQSSSGRTESINDDHNQPVAEVLGVNVHAVQCVDGRDRPQLERLARYILRPPVAQERLGRRADGRLELTLKSVWKDGTRALLLEPDDLLVRLCAAVPPPRMHQLRYFGVVSSHHALRPEVTRKFEEEPGMFQAEPAAGDQLLLTLLESKASDSNKTAGTEWRGRTRWGWLLRHVFRADVDACSECGGPMRWVEAATTQEAIGRLLRKHGLRLAAPTCAGPFVPRGQLPLPFT